MRTFIQIIILLSNLLILWLSIRWYANEKSDEALTVIIGQVIALLSLVYLALDERTANFKNLKSGKYEVTQKKPGKINMEGHENIDMKYDQ